MKPFVFVGNAPCEIGDRKYERFGSRAQFSLELAKDVLEGGGNFIPEDAFKALDFPEAELQRLAYAGAFAEPSAEFVEKRERAQAMVRELMANPAMLTEVFE